MIEKERKFKKKIQVKKRMENTAVWDDTLYSCCLEGGREGKWKGGRKGVVVR